MAIIKRRKTDNKEENVCALCDDGGNLIICEGGCLRSFHGTKRRGAPSKCKSLGITEEEYHILTEVEKTPYICQNCYYKRHQCFVCGILASSDSSSGPEVFQCKEQKCGNFYHPECVNDLLYDDDKMEKEQVAGAQRFSCPMHKCRVCKEAEDKHNEEMQFAVCRRCPIAYHRKCLPRDISFEAHKDGTPKRAWEKLITNNRILIFCMKHTIVRDLGTPKRDHIKFPDPNTCAAKRLKVAPPKEQDILDVNELPDHPSSPPSQARGPAESDDDPPFSWKPIDSFAPKALFPHPHPGSCGWLDE